MNIPDIEHRFAYHQPTGTKGMEHHEVRKHCGNLAVLLEKSLPEGREKSLALTKLEEVMFWANAAIARS